MNPEKWKSVVVPIGSYYVLKEMAAKERRTLSGQFTLLLEQVTGKRIASGEEVKKPGRKSK
jgi:hypothetical protein|tara:strand:- start:404 stop:586 length:183 start_codon:yes stop_codon:yes gene_type:complete